MSTISLRRSSYQPNKLPHTNRGSTSDTYYRVKTANGFMRVPEQDVKSLLAKHLTVQKVTISKQVQTL